MNVYASLPQDFQQTYGEYGKICLCVLIDQHACKSYSTDMWCKNQISNLNASEKNYGTYGMVYIWP